MGHRLYHIGPGDEHVAQVPNHEDEVGDRRTVHGTTGAGPEDYRDLRYHTGHQGVSQKDVGVAPERNHTFLNPGTARIVQPMTGAPVLSARSMILQIFSAWASESEPPKTVKSWENT